MKNDSADTYWFQPSAMDSDQSASSEASFAFHGKKQEENRRLDETFRKLRFQNPVKNGLGSPVWAWRTGCRAGVRFAGKEPLEKTLSLDPQVEEARFDFAGDLAYSQTLIGIGHVKDARQIQSSRTNSS